MSSYLARLKNLVSENHPPKEPSKGSKAPFEPFEGEACGYFQKTREPFEPFEGAVGRGVKKYEAPKREQSSPATFVLADPPSQPTASVQAWQACASSLEHDVGLPHELAEPFARLLCGAPPRGFEPHRWARVVEGASIFAEQWADQALRLGWSAEDVFGLDDIAPATRYDRKGLAWFLADGRRVIALDAGGADIETDRGVRQRFYRAN
jgi:hypothetical protein